mmetsp:Transcript_14027/g.30450  ORF Transcript_14027/g.30450 Transcript_14027/m.30450 type:complete len:123 (-) Transcript_14027:1015-1383(-)
MTKQFHIGVFKASKGVISVRFTAAQNTPNPHGYPNNKALHFHVCSSFSGLDLQIINQYAKASIELVIVVAAKNAVTMVAWTWHVASLPAAKGKPSPDGTIHDPSICSQKLVPISATLMLRTK